ncbi:MAG: type II secretion system protein GspL [Steroidobacteraceae bacterium]|jgi:general secretion pathway protein L|nr:type II secretion system protein GspL [Steroidobacteraceae bacterium]
MAETFVVRLVAPDSAEWLVVDAAGAKLTNVSTGTFADAAVAAGTRRVVALAPATDVLLARPEVPARSAQKLRQLVPFALEESLAADVESLHFAVGRPDADRRVPVAAVDRARLADWLSTLRSAGLAPSALYAETQVVPANPGHTVVLLEAGRVLARAPGEERLPAALEAEPLVDALAVLGLPPASGGAEAAPESAPHVIVYAAPSDWERYRDAVEALRPALGSLKVQLLPEGTLPLLAATTVVAPPFSLLQGEFAVRQGFSADWPRWRVAAGLAGALLALHLATLGVDWWRVRAAERAADAELVALAAQALPNVGDPARLPSVRAAVDARLRAARASVSGGLVGSLGVLASAAQQAPGTSVESLSYRDGVTDLTLDAPDVNAIDRIQQLVAANGYQAEMQGAEQREQRYRGRLQVRGGT